MTKLIDYSEKSKAKWIEVCHLYEPKPGSDAQVTVIAKFLDRHQALHFARQLSTTIAGPDAIVVR